MALFRPCSKSTKVSAGQSFFCSSSRVMVSPGRSSSMARISTGWPCSLIFMPFLRSSPVRGSSSNTPKRRVGGTELEVFTATPERLECNTPQHVDVLPTSLPRHSFIPLKVPRTRARLRANVRRSAAEPYQPALAHSGSLPPRTRNRGEEIPGEASARLSVLDMSDRQWFFAERLVGWRLRHHRRNPAARTISHLRDSNIGPRSSRHPTLR